MAILCRSGSTNPERELPQPYIWCPPPAVEWSTPPRAKRKGARCPAETERAIVAVVASTRGRRIALLEGQHASQRITFNQPDDLHALGINCLRRKSAPGPRVVRELCCRPHKNLDCDDALAGNAEPRRLAA